MQNHRINFTTYITAALSFVVPFTVYFLTMCPTISSGDSAELITNAFQLGLIHPPGYPLYTLIAKAFTYIPFNSVAWRVNLFSVITMALSVSFLFFTLNILIKRSWVSLMLALLYGFSALVWRYALVAEVFALNQLFLAAFLYLMLTLAQTKLPRYLILMSFVAGLALAHHHTFIFVAAPLFAWACLFLRKKLSISILLKACAVFILGLCPYALLFKFGNGMTLLSWGAIQNLGDLFHHILRLDYGFLNLGPKFDESYFASNLAEFFITMQFQSLFMLLPLLLTSIWYHLKNSNWLSSFFWIFIAALSYVLIFHFLAEINSTDPIYLSVLQRFWLLPYMLFFILAGFSFEFLNKTVFANDKIIIPVVILSGLVFAQLALNFEKNDQSKKWLYHDFAKTLLSSLDKDGILLVYGDLDVFTASYMQICEGLRPDVKIVSQARLTYPWYTKILKYNYPMLNLQMQAIPNSNQVSMFIFENISRHTIFTGSTSPINNEDWRKYYYELPVGFANKLVWVSQAPNLADYINLYGDIWNGHKWLESASLRPLDWDMHIIQRFYNSEYRRFDFIMQNYKDVEASQKNDLKARLKLLKNYYAEDAKLNVWQATLDKG